MVSSYSVVDSTGTTHRASLNEYNVALALEKLELRFEFQVEYFGGRIRGGQVLDFLVWAPFDTPLQVFGEYWHEGQIGAKDSLKLKQLREHFGVDIEIIWGKDSETPEDALAACRAIFF